VTGPPTWRDADGGAVGGAVGGAAAGPDPRMSSESMRRIGNALVAYGIAALVLAVIGLVLVLVAGLRLSGVGDRLETQVDQVIVLLDRTATVLDDATVTVADVASTLDSADPMIQRVANALTTTVTSLRGLQDSAAAVSILGTTPLGGLANRFGQVADSLDGIDTELAAFGDDLSSDANSLRKNVASLTALADQLHAIHDELGNGLIADTFSALRLMFIAVVAFIVAVAALPAVAALWIGRRIRSDIGTAAAA
jgi:hypothetical protein